MSKLNVLIFSQNRVMFIFLLLQLKLAFLGLEKLIHYGGEHGAEGGGVMFFISLTPFPVYT